MKPWLKLCTQGARFCADCVLACALWTLWIALTLLLIAQIGIAVSHELAVPKFLLRALEERLAASQVSVAFGRATLDPTGAVILENVRVSLPGLDEPVARVRAATIGLDPWALAVGRFEPRRVRATGISFSAPAMLSPSGRSEEIVSDLELDCVPAEKELILDTLTARASGLTLAAHGTLHFRRHPGAAPAALPAVASFAQNYPDLCRRLLRLSARLADFEQPSLHAEFTPSEERGAIALVTVRAAAARLAAPVAVSARGIFAQTRLPLFGDAATMAPLDLSVDELSAAGVSIAGLQARVRGLVRPADFQLKPAGAEITALRVAARGFTAGTPTLRLDTTALPGLTFDLATACGGEPVAVTGRADLEARTAGLHVRGAFAPALLTPLSEMLRRDIRRFVDFHQPVALDADVNFSAGWQFAGLTGSVSTRDILAYHVPLTAAHGKIEFDGRRFHAHHAKAVLGDNYATGSFEQDLKTRQFRFLLDGQLRPLAISGWFQPWWSGFFEHFEFPSAPPAASVDVAGWWGAGHRTTVFLFAEAAQPAIRGAHFDHARAILYIRPNFYDGLELFATRGAGDARGRFVRTVNLDTGQWRSLDFDVTSTIDPAVSVQIFGPGAAERLAPFQFEKPPHLRLAGRLDGPGAPDGRQHQRVTVEARSTGGFALHGFPVRDLSFRAVQNDDEIVLTGISAHFAEGSIAARSRIWGVGGARRLGFDGTLTGANLGQAITVLEEYNARRRGQPPPAASKFVQGKASVKLDLTASAEGHYDDLLSFHGEGHAVLAGPGLGEVRLLGLLSELFNFTALRFTAARANFQIDGSRLGFPEVSVTGANSAIEGHGNYALDTHTLDFKARVYPFQESKFFLQNVVGAVLTPLSTVLEVKLTGSLDKPSWAFVIGPTNFLRSLLPGGPAEPPKPTPSDSSPPYLKKP